VPRYFIDVRSRFGRDEDLIGVDLPDIEAAHGAALAAAQKLLERWSAVPSEARQDIAVEVIDEANRIVLTLPFWEIEQSLNAAEVATDRGQSIGLPIVHQEISQVRRDHREAVRLTWKGRHVPIGTLLLIVLIVVCVLSAILMVMADSPSTPIPS
jgi:hypothetical protein